MWLKNNLLICTAILYLLILQKFLSHWTVCVISAKPQKNYPHILHILHAFDTLYGSIKIVIASLWRDDFYSWNILLNVWFSLLGRRAWTLLPIPSWLVCWCYRCGCQIQHGKGLQGLSEAGKQGCHWVTHTSRNVTSEGTSVKWLHWTYSTQNWPTGLAVLLGFERSILCGKTWGCLISKKAWSLML